MNYWIDIASLVFACVTANHLGLVKAIENFIKKELIIINCPKCFTHWTVLVYSLIVLHDAIPAFAISLLCSYLAIWLELLEAYLDKFYDRLYEKIITTAANDTDSADGGEADTAGSMS